MTVFELFVIGLMLYGFAFLGLAAFRLPRDAPPVELPDRHDAPIFVSRGTGRESTVAVRNRTSRTI